MNEQKSEIRYCKYSSCNKPIDDKRKHSKYCSELCRTRNSALRQYNKVKNDEEFKKKRNEKNRKYWEENKERLKPAMRDYGMKYFFKKRDERKKLEEDKKLEELEKQKKEKEEIYREINDSR
jgi:hypothetical protein